MSGLYPTIISLLSSALFVLLWQKAVENFDLTSGKKLIYGASFFLVVILIFAANAALLKLEGRHAFYTNGPVKIWSGDIWSDQNSQQLADPYSFTHVTHGTLFYLATYLIGGPRYRLATRALMVLSAESLWEVLENSDSLINRFRQGTISLGYTGDTIFNSLGDLLACLLGFYLASRLPVKHTVLLVIIMEIVLVIWIRDSLILNMIMLLFPIPAIKNWQMGIKV